MKKRIGLDAIGYLGDVMWTQTNAPTPSMQDWPWRISNKGEAAQLSDGGLDPESESEHPGRFPEPA